MQEKFEVITGDGTVTGKIVLMTDEDVMNFFDTCESEFNALYPKSAEDEGEEVEEEWAEGEKPSKKWLAEMVLGWRADVRNHAIEDHLEVAGLKVPGQSDFVAFIAVQPSELSDGTLGVECSFMAKRFDLAWGGVKVTVRDPLLEWAEAFGEFKKVGRNLVLPTAIESLADHYISSGFTDVGPGKEPRSRHMERKPSIA